MADTLLWHWTCEHSRDRIGDTGTLLPAATLAPERFRVLEGLPWVWQARFVWLTDLPYPDRLALGLTSHMLTCDRMAHRYRVTDPSQCHRWTKVRRPFAADASRNLEVPGTLPRHWWVSTEPVPVEYDPLRHH